MKTDSDGIGSYEEYILSEYMEQLHRENHELEQLNERYEQKLKSISELMTAFTVALILIVFMNLSLLFQTIWKTRETYKSLEMAQQLESAAKKSLAKNAIIEETRK